MQRKNSTFVVLLTAVLLVGMFAGCAKDPVQYGGGGGDVASIELRLQYATMRGFAGQVLTQQITAIVRNNQGLAVAGQKVVFSIQNSQVFKGTISPATGQDTVTTVEGRFLGTYSVQLQQNTEVVIQASVGNVTGSAKVTLEVVEDIIGGITIEGPEVIYARPTQVKQDTISAFVYDRNNIGIRGLQVTFRTDPAGMGTVDSDTGTTDFTGRVKKTFSTVIGQYGVCTITAMVGDSSATKDISILPVSQPAYIVLLADPTEVNVAENQGADILLDAYVTDRNRVGVQGATVRFTVLPLVPEGPTFGVLSDTVDVSDASGHTYASFKTLRGSGDVFIVATVEPTGVGQDPIIDQQRITVNRLPQVVRDLTASANPSSMYLRPDSLGSSVITARVNDIEGNAIPDIQVLFDTDKGSISRATKTDSSGKATAKFEILPITDFNDPTAQRETVTITVSLPGTNISKDVTVEIQKFSQAKGTLQLYTDKTVIYADGGVTFATLSALLKDADNQVLTGKSIVFTSDFGAVTSPVTTDSSGIARAVFTDIGLPSLDEAGNPIPAVIFAKYAPDDLETWVEVTILERNPIRQIVLTAGKQLMRAGSGDSTEVIASCQQENGDVAPDGTEVLFRCLMGRFTEDRVYITTGNGRAATAYLAPQRTGVDRLTALVYNADGDSVISNEWVITLIPGPPSYVRLTAAPRSISTGDPNAFSEITAEVTDTAGNAVNEGTLVNFTTSLGVIQGSATTDTSGNARVRLTSGVSSGTALVEGSVNGPAGLITGTTTVTFTAGNPNSLELTADPLEIQVRGTGGLDFATLTATIRDPNGNLISSVVPVYFQLLQQADPPTGCNINNRGHLDSAFTSNGVARATLNAGKRSGAVLIRAYTWRDPITRLDEVVVVNATLQVVAGPPWLVDIDVDNVGEDVGGGSWSIEVSVRVYDFYRNPVANNIPVVFTVQPDIATISPGHTGNLGNDGLSTPGIAYADMVYNSNNTFDTLEIIATVQIEDGERSGTEPHVLPLQDGNVQLNLSPTNHMFNDADTPCNIRCWAVLTDGHAVRINNGPILFTSNRATFYRRNFNNQYIPYSPPEPAVKHTGWRAPEHPDYNEDDGVATVFLRGVMGDFFLDPFTLEVTVQIQAAVVGYNEVSSDPGFVFMTRH